MISDLAGTLAGSDAILIGNSGFLGRVPIARLGRSSAALIGLNAAPALANPHGVKLDYHVLFDWRFMAVKGHLVAPHLNPDAICVWGDHVQSGDEEIRNRVHRVPFLGYDGFSYNLPMGAFSGHTVALPGLQLCYHLRPRRVFLLGIDLNYGVNNPRFYQERRGDDVELHVKNSQIHWVIEGARALRSIGIEAFVVGDESNVRGHLPAVTYDELVESTSARRRGWRERLRAR